MGILLSSSPFTPISEMIFLSLEELQISAGFQELSLAERGGRRRDFHDLGVNTRQNLDHVKESKTGGLTEAPLQGAFFMSLGCRAALVQGGGDALLSSCSLSRPSPSLSFSLLHTHAHMHTHRAVATHLVHVLAVTSGRFC